MSPPTDRRVYPAHDDPEELHAAEQIVRLGSGPDALTAGQVALVLNEVPRLRQAARAGTWNAATVERVLRRGGRPKASAPKVAHAPAPAAVATPAPAPAAPHSKTKWVVHLTGPGSNRDLNEGPVLIREVIDVDPEPETPAFRPWW